MSNVALVASSDDELSAIKFPPILLITNLSSELDPSASNLLQSIFRSKSAPVTEVISVLLLIESISRFRVNLTNSAEESYVYPAKELTADASATDVGTKLNGVSACTTASVASLVTLSVVPLSSL